MKSETLVNSWFEKWTSGDFENLPVTENFKHTSPFGTIEGRKAYLELVAANTDKFLGYTFKIHDRIFEADRACVRYTGVQSDFRLDVSEWYYFQGNLISEIVAYYHIGEIREERQLSDNQ